MLVAWKGWFDRMDRSKETTQESYFARNMDVKTFLRAVCVGTIVLTTSATGWAQGINVALVDVGYIFQNHPGFKRQMEAMKAEVAKYEEGLKRQQQQIQAAGKQLDAYKPGSPDFKRVEEQTTKQLADLKVATQLKRKDVMEKEAQLYLATYKQVYAAVAAYAKQHRIYLVLRYDRAASPGTTADPRETLKIINRPVVYNDALDISDAILTQLGGVAARPQRNPQ